MDDTQAPRTLSAADILAVTMPAPVPVDVPEWGGRVFVRAMSGFERDAFELGMLGPDGKADKRNFRARLAAACLCDVNGHPLFTPADAVKLGAMHAAALSRVFDVAAELNGFTAGDVKELEKK